MDNKWKLIGWLVYTGRKRRWEGGVKTRLPAIPRALAVAVYRKKYLVEK